MLKFKIRRAWRQRLYQSTEDVEKQRNDCIFLIFIVLFYRIVPLNIIKTYQSIHMCMHFAVLFLYNAIHLKLLRNFHLPLTTVKLSKTVIATWFVARPGSNVPVKRAMLQQCCKTSCIEICSPFYGDLSRSLKSEKLFLQVVYVSRTLLEK